MRAKKTGTINVRVPGYVTRKLVVLEKISGLSRAELVADALLALADYVAERGKYDSPFRVVIDEDAAKATEKSKIEMLEILKVKDPDEKIRRLLGLSGSGGPAAKP